MYNLNGKVITHSNIGYKLYQDIPDMAEEDPDDIFKAVTNGLLTVIKDSKINPKDIKGVSFSSAMHSLILMDKQNQPMTKAITWADNRAKKYSDELNENGLGEKIYSRTGTPIHPMAPLSKILWIKNEYPQLFSKTSKFIDLKSYVFYKLFGIYKMDYSIASATGMFNIFNLNWDKEVLDLLGITTAQLPELVEPTEYVSNINSKYLSDIGISTSTPFIFGASDGTLSNLGVNAIDPGVIAVTIGTSGAVRTVVDKPVVDPNGKLFCYALTKDKWVVGGPVNNGGIVLRWVKEQLFSDEKDISYDDLTKMDSKNTSWLRWIISSIRIWKAKEHQFGMPMHEDHILV
jgi:Sugar (pentulose and hexulose) kinases